MSTKNVTAAVIADDPQVHENIHVHAVYDQIAPHFSSTRYKPWPIIANFLSALPVGWVGLDSGTGNGKYLPLPVDRPGSILTIGLDRSLNLLKLARNSGAEPSGSVMREVVWGDVLGNGWRSEAFDYAISIATIHHLASPERRKLAIQRLLQCVSSSHGRILIYVWAMEQDHLSKRALPKTGDPPTKAEQNHGQDVFVPWVLAQQGEKKSKSQQRSNRQISNQTEDPAATPTEVPLETHRAPVYNRYYHMFAKGELGDLTREVVREMGLVIGLPSDHVGRTRGVEIMQDGWERSNYYIELRCWKR